MLKHIKIIALAIYREFAGDPVRNAYDAVQEAMKRASRRAADMEYYKRMLAFYETRIENIDPYVDHVHAQDFADAMKSKYDHELDRQVEHKRVLEDEARLDALQAKYIKLKNGENR